MKLQGCVSPRSIFEPVITTADISGVKDRRSSGWETLSWKSQLRALFLQTQDLNSQETVIRWWYDCFLAI